MKERIFMCSPEFYGVEYEINPWMKVGTETSENKSVTNWNKLKELITRLGAEVLTMEPVKGLPDIVFTANAALMYKNIALISRFRYKERQPEEKYYAQWFKGQGYQVEYLPENMSFEGAGDALFSGEVLYSGYIPRSDIEAHFFISKLFDIKVLSLELVDQRFYHLDTCFCPLKDGYLLYYPAAFDEYANKVIEENFSEEKRIVAQEEEAVKFCCNAVNIGNSIIMNHTTDRLKQVLKEKGFDTYEIDFSEYLKAGGSAKCLTLKI